MDIEAEVPVKLSDSKRYCLHEWNERGVTKISSSFSFQMSGLEARSPSTIGAAISIA